jgi:tetratricopeptide (TPR) repeat protein
MRDALQNADRTIALLSAAYLASQYGTDEWTGAFLHDPDGRQRLLPVRVEACELPRLLAALIYIDLVGADRATARRRLLEGVKQGRRQPEQEPGFPGGRARRPAGRVEPRFPGQPPEISNLPSRNPNFTGRGELLDQLAEQLQAGRAAAVIQARAVYGLGGVGKTQLAIEYVHRHQADYDLVWWVTADQSLAIPGQLVSLARRLGIPEQAEQAETIYGLWEELGRRDRWLLVFDNAEAVQDLRPYWPPAGSGQVLVTSRNPAWGGLAVPLPVEVLPRHQAVAFLTRRIGGSHDPQALGMLAEALGDLPLALEQAAAYLEETGTPVGEYVALLRDRAPDLFALGRPATSEQTIATIWTVALERIRATTPLGMDLLGLCAFLSPDDLPRELLTDHPDALPEPLAVAVRDRLAFQQALGALRRYSLVVVTGDAIGMHRLVQAVVRHSLNSDDQQHWAATAVGLVLAAFPGRSEDVRVWPVAARLLPHVLATIDHADAVGADPTSTARLLHEAGRYLWGRAEHVQARMLHERALAIREAHLGPDHPDTAATLNSLANVLRDLGNPYTARAHLERALAVREARLGPNDPHTANTLHNLALVLYDLSDLAGARSLFERALAIREACQGPDHSNTAQSLNDLAVVLADQGDFDSAQLLFERALSIREARLGPDHPDTAQTLNDLAVILPGLTTPERLLERSRSLFERALAVREARLGPDHPKTAWSLNNLATVLRAQGDLDTARTLLERSLAIREARLGPNHPDIGQSLINLASVLADQGDLDTARSLLERSLAIREARFGPEDPGTAWNLNYLANVLRAQGELDTARTVLERALGIFEAHLDPNDVGVAYSLNNLANVLADQGDLDTAHNLHKRALAIREARLGPDHPATASSLNSLANVLRDQGDLTSARRLYERALAIREASLGADHPDTARSRRDLAAVVTATENHK